MKHFKSILASGVCMRSCCGAARGFEIHIVDHTNQVDIQIKLQIAS